MLYRSISFTNNVQNRNSVLHLVGTGTREIFETYQFTGNTYDQAITKSDEHYRVKKNAPFYKHMGKFTPASTVHSFLRISSSKRSYDMLNISFLTKT